MRGDRPPHRTAVLLRVSSIFFLVAVVSSSFVLPRRGKGRVASGRTMAAATTTRLMALQASRGAGGGFQRFRVLTSALGRRGSLVESQCRIVESSWWRRQHRGVFLSSSSPPPSSSFDADKIASMQKQVGQQNLAGHSSSSPLGSDRQGPTSTTSRSFFVEHQRRVFDDMATWFASDEAVPSGVRPAYQYLANRVLRAAIKGSARGAAPSSPSSSSSSSSPPPPPQPSPERYQKTLRLLDVGCGTGALFPFLKHAVQSWNDSNDVYKVQLRITGVDLSPNMIAEAQNKYRDWMAPTNDDKDNADVIVEDLISSDILEFTPPVSGGDDSSSINSWFFDVIVINACFGNFFDPRAVLEHLEALLVRPSSGSESFTTDDDGDDADAGAGTGKGTTGARICVTHPLGAAFVRKLHEECADTVPHVLPTLREMQSSLLLGLPLVLTGWEDRMPSATGSDPIYYAEIQSVRYRALPNVMRLRGTVASGFGRGGKKLGFPTANLGPTQVFELALEAVDTGVYFGWALVEKGDDGVQPSAGRYTEPPTIYKAVVNVGYSPTFQEQNPAKIVEAHLIEKDASTDRNLGDFYNQTLRLELIGYLRPELKFPTFPDLIAQITSDRGDASRALDQVPYSWFRDDPFLRLGSGSWIGCTGGDADASWELVPLESTLDTLAMRFGEE